jgi:hypothetical protein
MAGRRIIEDLKGSGCGLNEVLSGHLSQGTGWNSENLMIAGDPVEIRSENLPNTSLEFCLYTGL